MSNAIGFDVYGTLVNPLEMNHHLQPLVGDLANRFSELWREKQVEYAFRRGLMQKYEDFGVCTQQALRFTMQALQVDISDQDQEQLLEEYQSLQSFPDVAPGLEALKAQGHKLVAFSNGAEEKVRSLLKRANILQHLDGVLSVDDLKTFKPDPKVYDYLTHQLDHPIERTWLVSSNPWDVIGAKSAGLKAVWLKRKPDAVFDPWNIEPDIIVETLEDLPKRLG